MIYIYIIAGILVYAASFYGAYKFVQVAHSEKGVWEDSEVNWGDIFTTIMPLVNTMICILWIGGRPALDEDKHHSGLNKFFKVKK